uniref:Uncharacterized protein n=1 Tax=Candidatus Kentrum sp. MB TaxID=2138164 RepID=A0A450XJP4_9GAMM|nr:MAG: hypothetical protein BECKMB1821G_GA0114241_104825 [Candidatus Kentron sp. MB]
MRDCPICKRPELPEAASHCPQCGADLECFGLLNTLQDPETADRKKTHPSRGSKWTLLSLSALLVGQVALGGYLHMRLDNLATRITEIESITSHWKSNRNPPPSPSSTKQQIKRRQEQAFRKRIEELDRKRIAAWRRLGAALSAYNAASSPDEPNQPKLGLGPRPGPGLGSDPDSRTGSGPGSVHQ